MRHNMRNCIKLNGCLGRKVENHCLNVTEVSGGKISCRRSQLEIGRTVYDCGMSLLCLSHKFMVPRHGGQIVGQERGDGEQQAATDEQRDMALTDCASPSKQLQFSLLLRAGSFNLGESGHTHPLSKENATE